MNLSGNLTLVDTGHLTENNLGSLGYNYDQYTNPGCNSASLGEARDFLTARLSAENKVYTDPLVINAIGSTYS